MKILGTVRAIAVIVSGLKAGIFLGVFTTFSARSALDAASFVQHQQDIHVVYVFMMPALMLTTFVALAIWLWLTRSNRSAEFWLVLASLAGLIIVFAITRIVNVPINDQLMTWRASAPPANLREIWAPWERANAVRTLVSGVAFVLTVFAVMSAAVKKSI
ncbi:MAG: DUF1772 domain-containing protein [Pyrinomonadaceae bacterium]